MKQALFRWFVLTVAVWIAANIVPGISYDRLEDASDRCAGPGDTELVCKTDSSIAVASVHHCHLWILPACDQRSSSAFDGMADAGFHVSGFWPAAGGSLVISIVSMFLGYSHPHRRIIVDHTDTTDTYDPNRRSPPPGTGRIIDVE